MDATRGKLLALAGAAVVAFASGMALPFAAPQGKAAVHGVSLASGFLGLFMLFAWIQFDRRQRGVSRSRGFNFALAWFPVVAAPAYFVRHRVGHQRWKALLGLFLASVFGWNALLFAGIVAGALAAVVVSGAR